MPYTLKDKTRLAQLTVLHPELPAQLAAARPTTDAYGLSVTLAGNVLMHFAPDDIEFVPEETPELAELKKISRALEELTNMLRNK